MDSGNSGSMQSSSGGDDQEFDSTSSFPHNFASISAPQFLSHQTPNFFDSNLLTQSLDHASDGDLIWSRGVRSDNQAFSGLGSSPPPNPTPATPQQQQRNPKKRTRASRRAPTTVLTTDTNNFRQMVQEFTGVPAAPFSGGSPYSRRMGMFSAANLDGIGPIYPLRLAANKILSPFSSSISAAPPSQLLNSTMIASIAPTTTIANASRASKSSINPNDFDLYQQNPQMNFSNLSGFSASAAAAQHGDLSRWKRGETVRNNDSIHEFDGNSHNINRGESLNYNLNGAEKGMENAASSIAEGTVASWICSSE
ncbi:hypothetical protein SASPL_137085 [Salvia splendens]|uniref:VQ domain-containing protein n=1 Tax=Salvia splendens TaxID=180675 RepID=A0A8X8WR42_SALSN|nr:uncharacterized protein LOC121766099 [Salvia splendens]KAG6400260.1 hypothetical protein SASPL_137085 [Salvia splendens]